MKFKIEDYIGKTYNRLTIIGFSGKSEKDGRVLVNVKCICGEIKIVAIKNLKNGTTKSCGCLHREDLLKISTTHGLSKHPLFQIWKSMKQRCLNQNDKGYKNYGGRGVKISMRWENDFQAFYDWAIKRWKPGLQLDKDLKSSTGRGVLYCPELCCFVTRKQNCRKKGNNILITHENETLCVQEWSERLNIHYQTIISRYNRNLSVDKIFDKSTLRKNKQ